LVNQIFALQVLMKKVLLLTYQYEDVDAKPRKVSDWELTPRCNILYLLTLALALCHAAGAKDCSGIFPLLFAHSPHMLQAFFLEEIAI